MSTGGDQAFGLEQAKQGLKQAATKFAGQRVLVVGDLMLDHYIHGDVERISPEAPVPVVRVVRESHLLGGAANVALNIAAFGGKPVLLGLAGDDDAGRALRTLLEQSGIESRILVSPKRPTTIKTRILAHHQQIVRVDREHHDPLSDRLQLGLVEEMRALSKNVQSVLVSDYAKGVVTPKLMDAARSLPDVPLLVDPKPSHASMYAKATLLTPNLKEAQAMSGISGDSPDVVLRQGLAIFRKLKPRHLLITLGGKGMAVFQSPDRVFRIPTAAKSVFDVTGAGDTVIAALGLSLAAKLDLTSAAHLANLAAGKSVAVLGTHAVNQTELAQAIDEASLLAQESWLHPAGEA